MDKKLIMLLLVCALTLVGCGQNSDIPDENDIIGNEAESTEETVDMQAEDDGLIKVEIEKVDTTKPQVTKAVEEKKRESIKVAVVGTPAKDIIRVADEAISTSNYCLEVVPCDNYTAPLEMVISGEAVACLSSNQVFMDSYNKINESGLVIAERVYIDPLAIFPGKVTDLSKLTSGVKIAVSEGDVNVARALYLLEQKGILEVKEGASFQASMEDVTSNPLGISIEEVDISSKWPDINQYGLIICDYNRAILAGIDPETSIGEENRNSKILDLFTVNLVVNAEKAEDPQTKIILDAINEDSVEEYIKDNFYRSVLDYK